MSSKWLGAGYLYQEKHEKDLEKHTKRKKNLLIWAGGSTLSMFVFLILSAIIGNIFPDRLETLMNLIMPIMIICGLGIYAWPFFVFHLIKKNKVEKFLEKLPPHGNERFNYVKQLYSGKKWKKLNIYNSETKKQGFKR